MSRKKERFSNIEELELSAMSRGIAPGELAMEIGFPWKRHRVVLTKDGIFHFFRNGREVDPPDSLVDISEISEGICDEDTRNVSIPSSVTSIGDEAFSLCTGLTGVTIPDSVTSIGDSAFSSCSGLMSISVGSGNANYKSVKGLLLSKDGKTLIQGVNGNVTIPDSVTSIGAYAFDGCSGLMSVTIGNGVTNIGSFAFSDCSGLTSVTIPDSVTSIGYSAFYGCAKLKSIIIPRRFENDLEGIGIDLRKTKVSFSC